MLNKTSELKKGLEKGLTIELACVDPSKVTPSLEKVFFLYKSDIDSALNALRDLLNWAIKTNAKGSIELKYHWADFPDSVFIFVSKSGEEKLVWDLSFGRDLTQKRIIIFDTDYPLGENLRRRYLAIYQNAALQIQYSNGKIKHNNFDWNFDNKSSNNFAVH